MRTLHFPSPCSPLHLFPVRLQLWLPPTGPALQEKKTRMGFASLRGVGWPWGDQSQLLTVFPLQRGVALTASPPPPPSAWAGLSPGPMEGRGTGRSQPRSGNGQDVASGFPQGFSWFPCSQPAPFYITIAMIHGINTNRQFALYALYYRHCSSNLAYINLFTPHNNPIK